MTPENEPSLQEILQFDPFPADGGGSDTADTSAGTTDGSAEAAPPGGGQSGEEKPEGAVAPQQASQPASTTAVSSGEPPKPVSQADLQAAIRDMSQQVAGAVRAAVPPQPSPAEQPQPNKFNLGVPDALVNALRSEDPKEFSAGVGAMINGVANHVWNAFTEHLVKDILPNIPRMIEGHTQSIQRQEAVARDFYGAYPQLQIPELTSAIQTIGAQIAQEYAMAGKPLGWSSELRDAIAERIFMRLPMLRTVPAAAAAAPAARRSFATGNGARPPVQTEPTEQQDMMKMIFGG